MDPVHVMIDVEGLGTKRGSALIEVALVSFDHTGVLWSATYWLNPPRQISVFKLRPEIEVYEFWMSQPEEVRAVLDAPRTGQIAIDPTDLSAFVRSFFRGRRALVWSRGPTYDMALLSELMYATGHCEPWDYRDERCVRTATAGVPAPERTAARHVALNDAMHQVEHMLHVERRWPGFLERQTNGGR